MSVLIDPPKLPYDSPLAALRRDYQQKSLSESEVDPDPFVLFEQWFKDALSAHAQQLVIEPNAMVLSTTSPEGEPRGRFVLLKHFDARGFVFFTNYESTKGQHLQQNPKASLTFGWLELERQICIAGTVEKVAEEETKAYFMTRPRGSQLGAWASPQSTVVADRAAVDAQMDEVIKRFPEGSPIPVPPHWGGYRVIPTSIEFWQGRSSRLHDRLRYLRELGGWKIIRLAS